METGKDEKQSRTIWKKILKHDREETQSFFPRVSIAGVYCVHEVSGYAVWYRRALSDPSDEVAPTPSLDGNYLLKFFDDNAKNEAIEFAVLTAMPGEAEEDAIAQLDELAKTALRVEQRSHHYHPLDELYGNR